jgi:hypothetical protein
MERDSFPRAFEVREQFLYFLKFLCGICEIWEKKRPCKRAALSIGDLLGNMKGVRLLGHLREKENAHLDSFFLDPEDIKS